MSNTTRFPSALGALLALALVMLVLGFPRPAGATEAADHAAPGHDAYAISGYEVWFGPNLAVFAGTGNGTAGQLTAWYSSIEHSGIISPSGSITGGWATLYRADGTRISGWFEGGTVELVDPGAGCTAETHVVSGRLFGVSRSGGPAVGQPATTSNASRGSFEATLVHHRVWLLGRCISYSATVSGTISLHP